ncbi:ENTH domain-containing protein [Aphelenchoides besseyi]|nr:ENTH domain-containing protein [Aphelenchoides besseyi]
MFPTLRRTVKNTTYSAVQVRIRKATCNDNTFPLPGDLNYLAHQTQNPLRFVEVMGILWKRLNENATLWRHIYKSLIVLEHLLIYGHPNVVEQAHENISILLRLQNFQLHAGKVDHGLVVRELVARVLNLLNSPDKLEQRRKEVAEKKQRRMSTPAPVASNSVQVVKQPNKQRRSELLASAPKDKQEESAQLQLVIALSHRIADKSNRSSNEFGIQPALEFASQEKSALDDELFVPECPPSSPAVLDLPVDQQLTTAADESQPLIDVFTFVPVTTTESEVEPADPLAWIDDYNQATITATVQSSSDQRNPFSHAFNLSNSCV